MQDRNAVGAPFQGARRAARTCPASLDSARLAASVSRPQATITIAGAVTIPVLRINEVAIRGAVPLNNVNATLKTSATPLNRIRVGNRLVRITANVPLTNAAHNPARTISSV